MSEKVYDKLVRDKIPEIIEKSNKKLEIEIVSKEVLLDLLNKKLTEEVNEYLESKDVEELADILEVIHGILENKNITFDELEKIRLNKKAERGGFSKGIKLLKVF